MKYNHKLTNYRQTENNCKITRKNKQKQQKLAKNYKFMLNIQAKLSPNNLKHAQNYQNDT